VKEVGGQTAVVGSTLRAAGAAWSYRPRASAGKRVLERLEGRGLVLRVRLWTGSGMPNRSRLMVPAVAAAHGRTVADDVQEDRAEALEPEFPDPDVAAGPVQAPEPVTEPQVSGVPVTDEADVAEPDAAAALHTDHPHLVTDVSSPALSGGFSGEGRGGEGRRPGRVCAREDQAVDGESGAAGSGSPVAEGGPLRGEQLRQIGLLLSDLGSPPLARGAVRRLQQLVRQRRVTPARAGSRLIPARPESGGSGHPRSRGEQRSAATERRTSYGSPPLARGAEQCGLGHGAVPRVTPARAGSRWAESPTRARTAGHPRSRGEQEPPLPVPPVSGGSPPLARGAGRPASARRRPRRVTPARAGSRGAEPPDAEIRAGHPRSRGEQLVSAMILDETCGSPPLARGAASARHVSSTGARVTPARAGSRSPSTSTWGAPPGHPRSRGEQASPAFH
jgi:hypothetical protein